MIEHGMGTGAAAKSAAGAWGLALTVLAFARLSNQPVYTN